MFLQGLFALRTLGSAVCMFRGVSFLRLHRVGASAVIAKDGGISLRLSESRILGICAVYLSQGVH